MPQLDVGLVHLFLPGDHRPLSNKLAGPVVVPNGGTTKGDGAGRCPHGERQRLGDAHASRRTGRPA